MPSLKSPPVFFPSGTTTVFQGDTLVALAFKHATETPPDPRKLAPDMSQELSELILKCLEKEPEKRFQTVAELAEAVAKKAGALRGGG